MYPLDCDSACQSHRHHLYIAYLTLFLVLFGVAFCHFMVTFIRRLRIKEEAREYYISHQMVASLAKSTFLQPQKSEQLPSYVSKRDFQVVNKDAFKITTDSANQLIIEVPEEYQLPRAQPLSGKEKGGTNHKQRPLPVRASPTRQPKLAFEDTDLPISHDLGGGEGNDEGDFLSNMQKSIVRVDVHATNRRNSANSAGSYDRALIPGGPPGVSVATVSGVVSQMTDNNKIPVPLSDHAVLGLGKISRPQSAHSTFDVSDLMSSSPECCANRDGQRTPNKAKTC